MLPMVACVISLDSPTVIVARGESVSMYPRRPKAEAFSNAVDVVERLHDPTDPSTERTADVLELGLSRGAIATRKLEGVMRDKEHEGLYWFGPLR